jgi:hypothetical protein
MLKFYRLTEVDVKMSAENKEPVSNRGIKSTEKT